jgi:hypothetical protein
VTLRPIHQTSQTPHNLAAQSYELNILPVRGRYKGCFFVQTCFDVRMRFGEALAESNKFRTITRSYLLFLAQPRNDHKPAGTNLPQ